MPNPILDALKAQVEASTQVEASAVLLINGIAQRIADAVDALKASAQSLADAVAANTPPPPPTP